MENKIFFLAAMLASLMVIRAQEVSLATLNSRLTSLEATVAGCSCVDDVVAFSVNMGGDASDVAVAQHVIPFPKVVTNAGNGYSPITNSFTAPSRGVYAFFVHLDVTPEYVSATITRNGQQVRATGQSDGDSRFLSAFVVLNLNAGDIIDIRHGSDNGEVDGGGESTFGGFRLGDIPHN